MALHITASLAQLLLCLLITTLHISGAAALPVGPSSPAGVRRDTVYSGHGVVLGPGGTSAGIEGTGGVVITPGQVQPVDFGASSHDVDLGNGVPLRLTGGDLSVDGTSV